MVSIRGRLGLLFQYILIKKSKNYSRLKRNYGESATWQIDEIVPLCHAPHACYRRVQRRQGFPSLKQ